MIFFFLINTYSSNKKVVTTTTRQIIESSRNTGTITRTYNYTVTTTDGSEPSFDILKNHKDETKIESESVTTTIDDYSKPTITENSNNFTKFQVECLNEHNGYRKKHGVPELKLNKEICDYAQEWANVSNLCGIYFKEYEKISFKN